MQKPAPPPANAGPMGASRQGQATSEADDAFTQQRNQIRVLTEQVRALQEKLGELHSTDVSSLRRAYKTLIQHVQALEAESKGLGGLIRQVDGDVLTPEFVAKEAGLVASVTAVLYTLHKALRALDVPVGPAVVHVATAGAMLLVGVRLVVGIGRRIVGVMQCNRQTKRQMEREWKAVAERISIMADLCSGALATDMANFRAAPAGAPAGKDGTVPPTV